MNYIKPCELSPAATEWQQNVDCRCCRRCCRRKGKLKHFQRIQLKRETESKQMSERMAEGEIRIQALLLNLDWIGWIDEYRAICGTRFRFDSFTVKTKHFTIRKATVRTTTNRHTHSLTRVRSLSRVRSEYSNNQKRIKRKTTHKLYFQRDFGIFLAVQCTLLDGTVVENTRSNVTSFLC